MAANCSICGATLADGTAHCGACAAPAGEDAGRGKKSACRHCQAVLWSLAEACPSCGEGGYPALGPRFGGTSKRSPDWENTHQ